MIGNSRAYKERLLKRRRDELYAKRRQRRQKKIPYIQDEGMRKWDELEHDILVIIMSYLVYEYPLAASLACKSWMSAMVDSIFPPGYVLDLRVFDKIAERKRPWYARYLHIALNRPHQYTKLFIPIMSDFKYGAYTYIAQRLPALKCVVEASKSIPFSLGHMVGYLAQLEEAHCNAAGVSLLSKYCKRIRRLDLCGRIGDDTAYELATHLPQLVHLNISSCRLSPNVLSIILQGRINLRYLDTRHAYCVKALFNGKSTKWFRLQGNVIEWDEHGVSQILAGIRTYLGCTRNNCSYCSPLYSPHTSLEVLRRFSVM